eukprot:1160777-Pelagomonas_calceolata.AAC.14
MALADAYRPPGASESTVAGCLSIPADVGYCKLTPNPASLVYSYCKPQHAFYDLAADVIAENPQYVAQFLDKDMQDYLQATIMQQVGCCSATACVGCANCACRICLCACV